MYTIRTAVLSLCLAAAGISIATPAEPNDIRSELTFQTSSERADWIVRGEKTEEGKTTYYHAPGPIKPTHAAEVVLSRDVWPFQAEQHIFERIKESPIAQKLSQSQTDFLNTGFAIWIDDETHRIPKHYSIWIYALSENDAKTSVRAFLDTCAKRVEQHVQERKDFLSKTQRGLEQAKKELPEKETALKNIEQEYTRLKNSTHVFCSDVEAGELAKETILEMDKMLDTLRIELAGIREKLKAIEKFRNERDLSTDIRGRLDQMFVEQTIELSGLEARRIMTQEIRAKEERFLGLFNERGKLQTELGQLEKSINRHQNNITKITHWLENQPPYVLPPRVYRDRVTIWRVKGGYTPEERKKIERVRKEMEKEMTDEELKEMQSMGQEDTEGR